MNRIEQIRLEEKKYHDACYAQHTLFEPGSWLHKPVQTILDLMEELADRPYLSVLDLGCGVGRNSIPIAETLKSRNGKVVCVDLLSSAIQKLEQYSREYGVQPYIEPHVSSIEQFDIEPLAFDLIVAVSALEHVSSKSELERKLGEIESGTKPSGMNCLIISSNVREMVIESQRMLEPMYEVNLPTDSLLELLDQMYSGWDVVQRLVKPLSYHIERNGLPVRLTSDCITYVAKKGK